MGIEVRKSFLIMILNPCQATWKDGLMVFGSVDGAIRTLNRDGALGTFIESSEEIKDDLTLQLTYFLPQPGNSAHLFLLHSFLPPKK